jgi:hypothetical protein
MIAWVIGCAVVGAPVVFAARVLTRLRSTLGSVDASALAEAMRLRPDLPLSTWTRALEDRAPGSISARLVRATDNDADAPVLPRTLALAEIVADIERELSLDVRLPRVAASLASTSGLLAATFVMRSGLSGAVSGDSAVAVSRFTNVVEQGLTLAAIAILGGLTCAAIHRASQRERRSRLAELDALAGVLLDRIEVSSRG